MNCSVIITNNEKGVCDAPLIYKNQAKADQVFIFHVISTIEEATQKRYFPDYITKFAKIKKTDLSAETIIRMDLEEEFLKFMTENYSCTYDYDLKYFLLRSGHKRIEISMYTVPTGD